MTQRIHPAPVLVGEVKLPADKSIAHRSAMFAALAEGTSHIVNYPPSADPQSTLACMRQLGVEIREDDDLLIVEGRGLHGLRQAADRIDCGNSGTTMRLLSGILAGQPFDSTLIGDASLSKRPMTRIANPLGEMGAQISMTDGHAPLHITGISPLRPLTYRLPMASAQVKSAVLLGGLYADGETTVIEPVQTRDHTERMLGLSVFEMDGVRHISVEGGHRIAARTWSVPRDFSAAAFFMVAGSIAEKASLQLKGVGLNPTRSALLDVLRAMGANIEVKNEREHGGEPIADLVVREAQLQSITLDGGLIANLIDEIPILAVAATQAEGRTEIRDAHELRVKETDRIDAMVTNLRALGAEVEEFEDGFAIEGGRPLTGAHVETYDDHRIAMAMGVAGLIAKGETVVHEADVASVSFPSFWTQLGRIAGRAE
ncbi:MAG: 3-phosphoshikimate 1-carboxyvinyltransferase [Rhodothermales bacterium]